MNGTMPHLKIIVAFCVACLSGYAAFSIWAVIWSQDAGLIGDVGGTWKSFAVAVVAFWVGSSSAGKLQGGSPPEVKIANTRDDPAQVEVQP